MSSAAADPRLGGRAARVVYDQATIARRVAELGREITAAYPAGELLLIGMLKGSFIFLADLIRGIERPLAIDFVVASSYGTGTTSSGAVTVHYRPTTPLGGKHVVLVEDIIDSGHTLRVLAAELAAAGPASLALCALLDKGLTKAHPAPLRFLGFRAPRAFLVGYGLDHAEEFRHLPYIVDLG
jgi:hypoxanthine phosphoribosyltransferase